MEEWRPIPGYEGLYEASDQGQVRSLTRLVDYGDSRGSYRIPTKILKPTIGTFGYPRVNLYKDGKMKHVLVHRQVLLAFRGDPSPGQEACHEDGDPGNAALSNLRWDTPKANQADKIKHGTIRRGEDHVTSKLTKDQVLEIRRRAEEGKQSQREIAADYGVHQNQVSRIKRRVEWAWL